jgi:hypothetical protein
MLANNGPLFSPSSFNDNVVECKRKGRRSTIMTFPTNNLTTTRELTSFINLVVPYFEIKNKPYPPPPPLAQNYFLFFLILCKEQC